MNVRLWTINRWLRWTGFRLFVSADISAPAVPTRLGIVWCGLMWSKRRKQVDGK